MIKYVIHLLFLIVMKRKFCYNHVSYAIRLHIDSYKARLNKYFSQSVFVRDNFSLNSVVPVWNSLSGDVFSSSIR